MKKLKVSILVEVTLDASQDIVHDYVVTGVGGTCGGYPAALKHSIERAEESIQALFDRHGKRFGAVVGADYESVAVREIETPRENYLRRCREHNDKLMGRASA